MVKILLWNTQGSKENLQVLLETAEEDILAIQEPWINPQANNTTYCPRGSKYHLVFQPSGRAALYIYKRLPI